MEQKLIIFPEPYVNVLIQSARVTIVECDGRGVRVGLLVSNSEPHKYGRHINRGNTRKNSKRAVFSDIFTNRTETFGN